MQAVAHVIDYYQQLIKQTQLHYQATIGLDFMRERTKTLAATERFLKWKLTTYLPSNRVR